MKCDTSCPHYKKNDAVREVEDGVEWYCTLPHSQCDDFVCLLKMILWELDDISESLGEK